MKKLDRGVSLLEVVIAIQCTALLLALICRVLPLAGRQVREADRRLGGALAAQNVLEEYLVVAPREWPKEPVTRPDSRYQVLIEGVPFEEDSRLLRARATVLVGNEEVYRLETLVHP